MTPRVRIAVSARELMLALGVLGIGVFITAIWLRHPEGHTMRRLAIGIAALAVGVAVVCMCFRRSCSACHNALRTVSFRTTASRIRAVELSFAGGDAPGAARLLRDVGAGLGSGGGTSQEASTASCSLVYCDGCRGLLSVTVEEGGGERRTQLVTGTRATALVPVVEAMARSAEEAG